jgi:hypothetical protein
MFDDRRGPSHGLAKAQWRREAARAHELFQGAVGYAEQYQHFALAQQAGFEEVDSVMVGFRKWLVRRLVPRF